MTASQPPSDRVVMWLAEVIRPLVDARIERSLSGRQYQAELWYQTGTGGKRLRPGITILIGELCGCDWELLLDSAAGIELLHEFSLIHDDLVDGDRVRRDEPAFWVKYGQDDAVNIGDMLLVHALSVVPDDETQMALNTVREMAVGQQLDFELTERRDVTEAEYMEMAAKKTGALFDLCVELPQTLSNTDLDIDGLSALWPAFQIRDDLLDFEEGKGRAAIGNDVRAGKRTLMVVHADDERIYDILDTPAADTTDEDVAAVQAIFEETGSFEYARKRMSTLATTAMASVETLPESPRRTRLRAFCRFCTTRED